MQRPRLVASDVDGTLLDPTDRVSERTRAAVHRVLAVGVPFVLVTGRPPRWIPPIVEQLGHAGHAVCANGAVLYDAATDCVSYSAPLDPLQLRDAANVVATALPGAKLAVELPTGRAMLNGFDDFRAEPGYTHPWPDAESVPARRDQGHRAGPARWRTGDRASRDGGLGRYAQRPPDAAVGGLRGGDGQRPSRCARRRRRDHGAQFRGRPRAGSGKMVLNV